MVNQGLVSSLMDGKINGNPEEPPMTNNKRGKNAPYNKLPERKAERMGKLMGKIPGTDDVGVPNVTLQGEGSIHRFFVNQQGCSPNIPKANPMPLHTYSGTRV